MTSLLSEDDTSSLLTKVYHILYLEWKKENTVKIDNCFNLVCFMTLLFISYILTNVPEKC